MIGFPYNPNDCVFLLNQSLNANQFNPSVPYSNNKTNHNLLWDFIAQKIYWVNSQTNLIESEISGLKIITTTYQDFYNTIINSELEIGAYYRITDYKSVNFLNGFDLAYNNPPSTNPNFNPRQLHIGDDEIIIVQAISEKSISPIAYSENYPEDLIQFNPYANKYGLEFSINNGNSLPNGDLVSGFGLQWDAINNEVYFEMPIDYPILYGQRLYLVFQFLNGVDTLLNEEVFDVLVPGINTASNDYAPIFNPIPSQGSSSRIRIDNNQQRVVLIDLTYIDFTQYVNNTLFISTAYAISDAYGYIQQRFDTKRTIKLPCDFRGYRYRRFEVDLTAINPYFPIGYWGQGDNYQGQGTTGNFKDFPIFQVGFNLILERISPNPTFSVLDNFVAFDFRNVTIGIYGAINCTFKEFYSNSIFGLFNNTIYYCSDNDCVSLNYNLIKTFQNNNGNNFGNIICETFYTNTITNSFGGVTIRDFSFNQISGEFYANTLSISKTFRDNTIIDDFYENQLPNDFFNNRINQQFSRNIMNINPCSFLINDASIDNRNFSASTIIYQTNLTKNTLKRQDGTIIIGYLNNSNTMVYNNVNF